MKKAPSIFQRAIDDVLIIFSENMDDHVKHIAWVLDKLYQANMRVSREKSNFFKDKVELLGFVVSCGGIATCPNKVEAIRNYEQPTTLFNVRSFLGLASYYRCFIKDFASIARPLSEILKGENGKVSASQSKKIQVTPRNNARHSRNLKRFLHPKM